MCTYFYTCMYNTLGEYILSQVLEGPLFSGSFQSRGNTHKPRKIKLLHTVLMEPRQHLLTQKSLPKGVDAEMALKGRIGSGLRKNW